MNLIKPCLQCGTCIIKQPNRSLKDWHSRTKYCSKKCRAKCVSNSVEWRRKQSEAHMGKKNPHTKEWNEKISKSLQRGGKPKCKVCNRQLVSYKAKHCKRHRPITEETRMKRSIATRGSRSHAWRGGLTPVHQGIRQSVEYRLWREVVYRRDDYTCVHCGQRGGELNADHIKQFAYYPKLRFDIDNGRTLCKPCHKKTDSYSRKIKLGSI